MKPFYKVHNIQTVRDIIDLSATRYPDRPAFEIKKGQEHYNITYTQYREDINAMSTALIHSGITDARVAVVSDNRYEYALTYLSVICSGGVIVPVDKELHLNDIMGILKASDAKFLFCDPKHAKIFEGVDLGNIRLIVFGFAFDDFVAEGRKMNQEGNRLYETMNHDPEKLCTLLFTSGTTGISKGVMLCQRNFAFEIKAAMGVLKIHPEDCGISLLPLHHTFESSIILFFAPYCGAKVTFCEGFKYVLRNMKEFNPSVFVAVPLVLETVHKRILREIHKKKHGELKFKIGKALCKFASRFHINLRKVVFREIQETFGGNMRMIICGGAPIDPQIIEDFDSFGIQVVFGYGLTECAPLAIINHDRLHTTDSIGEPLPGVDAKIENPDANGIGEVCVKGGMVMLGYFNNPEATAAVMDKDGFFHTGDLGFVDKKGHYHLTGRCKSVIVTANGKNIYPEELEYHLDRNRFVAASMVEEATDKHGDVTVHAQLFPDKEELCDIFGEEPTTEQIDGLMKEVVDEVNNTLPPFKRIRSFSVRKTDFIRTTAQKIKRKENKSKP